MDDALVRRLVCLRADARDVSEVRVPQRCCRLHGEVTNVDGSGLEDLELSNLEAPGRIPIVLHLGFLQKLQPQLILLVVPITRVDELLPQRSLAPGVVLGSKQSFFFARVCGCLPVKLCLELTIILF